MKLSAKIAAIEIDGDEVRVALVKTGSKVPRVLEAHAVRAQYADPGDRFEALTLAVQEAVEAIKGRPVAYMLCASSAFAIARQLTIPFKGSRRVADAVRFELEPYLAFPIEELVVGHTIIREIDGETEVLCIGLRRDQLEQQAAILDNAGISVDGIGLDVLGMTGLWMGVHKAPGGIYAILHVRDSGAILAIIQDKRLAYIRYIATSRASFQEKPQAAAREVQNILRAFSSGRKGDDEVSGLSVTGLPLGVEESLAFEDEFAFPVRFDELVSLTKGAGHLEGVLSLDEGPGAPPRELDTWAATVGGADCAAGGPLAMDFKNADMIGGNSARNIVRRAIFSAALFMVALTGYGTYMYMDYKGIKADIEMTSQQVWEEFAATFPNSDLAEQRPPGDLGGFISLQEMQREAERKLQGSSILSVDMFTQPTMLAVLAVLAESMPDAKVGITNLTITSLSSSSYEIRGNKKDVDAFDDVLAALSESNVFKVDPDPKQSSVGGNETFVITARN